MVWLSRLSRIAAGTRCHLARSRTVSLNAGGQLCARQCYGRFGPVRWIAEPRCNRDPLNQGSEIHSHGRLASRQGDQFVVVADRDQSPRPIRYREQKARETHGQEFPRFAEGLAEQKGPPAPKNNIILRVDGRIGEVLGEHLSNGPTTRSSEVLRFGVGAITGKWTWHVGRRSNAIIHRPSTGARAPKRKRLAGRRK